MSSSSAQAVPGVMEIRVKCEPIAPLNSINEINGLCKRLCKLLSADSINIFEVDILTGKTLPLAAQGELMPQGAVASSVAFMQMLDFEHKSLQQIDSSPDDSIHPQGLTSADGSALAICIAIDCRVVIRLIATRAADKRAFNVQDERTARDMAVWVAEHLRLWWQLRRNESRGNCLSGALDAVGVAVYVLDRAGVLIELNRAASVLLDESDGLRAVDQMLTAVSLDDAARLHAAIVHARQRRPIIEMGQLSPLLAVSRRGRRPLAVAVTSSHCSTSDPTVIVQAVDPESDIDHPIESACALYGFTGAEARLTKILLHGASLTEAAAQMHVQPPTARTYLKQIFAKTGTNRQAALVQLMLTSVVRIGPGLTLKALSISFG